MGDAAWRKSPAWAAFSSNARILRRWPAWYRDNLGFNVEGWGGVQFEKSEASPSVLVWTPFRQDTDHFAPSSHEFMLNFVVDDLDGMIAELAAKGIAILKREDGDTFGRFAWLLDPAGIKIELWEPKPES